MATYTGTQRGRAPIGTTACAGPWLDSNKVTPTAALGTSDVVVLLDVPAGVRLETFRFYNGDFDTATTAVYDIGYRTKLPGGSATDLDYIANDATAIRAATTSWQELVFEPVKFDEPVEIVLICSVAPTGVSGTPSIFVQATGVIEGIN